MAIIKCTNVLFSSIELRYRNSCKYISGAREIVPLLLTSAFIFIYFFIALNCKITWSLYGRSRGTFTGCCHFLFCVLCVRGKHMFTFQLFTVRQSYSTWNHWEPPILKSANITSYLDNFNKSFKLKEVLSSAKRVEF